MSAAFGFGWAAHTDIGRYARTVRPEVFRRYFKFTVVRNPWERLLSEYMFQRRKRKPAHEKPFIVDERGNIRSFSNWVEVALSSPAQFPGANWAGDVSPQIHRWSPQLDWISVDGDVAVDFVARAERLATDFETIRHRAGLPAGALPHRNRTPHRHYSTYYDARTRALVGEYYAKDIEYFGYTFESEQRRSWWRRH